MNSGIENYANRYALIANVLLKLLKVLIKLRCDNSGF